MGYRGWTKNHAAVNPAEAKERPCHWPERHVPWSNWNEIEKKNGEHQTTTTLINSLRRPFDLSFRYIQPFRASTIEKLLYWPMKRDTKLAARNNTTEGEEDGWMEKKCDARKGPICIWSVCDNGKLTGTTRDPWYTSESTRARIWVIESRGSSRRSWNCGEMYERHLCAIGALLNNPEASWFRRELCLRVFHWSTSCNIDEAKLVRH